MQAQSSTESAQRRLELLAQLRSPRPGRLARPLRFGAYIYARESDPLQQDSNDMQCDRGHEYAARIAVPVLRELQDGMSGLLAERKNYQLMLAEAEAGKFSHLILFKVDRIAREDKEFVVTCHRLMDLGIEIHDSIRGRLRRADIALEAYLSYREVCAISERTTSKMNWLTQKEARQLSRPLPGYRPVPGDAGRRQEDPTAWPVIRQVFTDYAAGRSLVAITRDLNEALGLRKMAKDVRYLLRHEYYSGVVVRGKVRKSKIDGYHRQDKSAWQVAEHDGPRIDQETWERVQARLDREREQHTGSGGRRPYALSGLLWCAACDLRLSAHSHRYPYALYRCPRCLREVAGRRVEDAMQDEMRRIPLEEAELRAAAEADDRQRQEELEARRCELAGELEAISAERTHLTRQYGKRKIDDREYQAAMSQTQDERDRLEGLLEELDVRAATQERARLNAQATVAYLLELGAQWPTSMGAAPEEDRRACYAEVVKRVRLDWDKQRLLIDWSEVVARLLGTGHGTVPLAEMRRGRKARKRRAET